MDHIYCLVGPSGAGKTTVARALHGEGYNVIQSYTTRPKRTENEWGHTFGEKYSGEKVIAYNNFNGYEYWSTEKQYLGKGKTIYVIDPPGDKALRESVSCPVTTIFMAVGPGTAAFRMEKSRGHEVAAERIKHDREVFACVKTDWVVNANMGVGEVLECIRGILKGK